ncbi:MAG: STAS domain-containing protein [Nocardioidaceae bacterium]
MSEQSQRPSLFEVSLVPDPPCLCLTLRGELDLCSARELPRETYSWHRDLTMVLVDLGELTFCDCTGVRALLAFRRIHEAQGRSVVVIRATPFMWRLLQLCGVSDRLRVERPASTIAV